MGLPTLVLTPLPSSGISHQPSACHLTYSLSLPVHTEKSNVQLRNATRTFPNQFSAETLCTNTLWSNNTIFSNSTQTQFDVTRNFSGLTTHSPKLTQFSVQNTRWALWKTQGL